MKGIDSQMDVTVFAGGIMKSTAGEIGVSAT